MNIEIKGIGFGNRGAELMLIAILDRMSKTFPGSRFAAATYSGPCERRARYGLLQILQHDGLLGRLLRAVRPQNPGIAREDEMDVLLDASGYAYGDAWKPQWVENSAAHILRYRERGSKVVLLPQAFGPFKNPAVRAASEKILRAADLVCARDAESLKHIREIVPDVSSVYQYPDFTGPLPGRLPEGFVTDPRRVCAIPNTEMLRSAPDVYQKFLVNCIVKVRERGFMPCVLLHEQDRDVEMAEKLSQETGAPVLNNDDPLCLKGIIGSCAFTIGSRYHGLISSLSQGVPALGTFWSHKYKFLFEDYGCPEMLMDIENLQPAADRALDALCDDFIREKMRLHLLDKRSALISQTEQMWQQVEKILQS